jgi:hypothetical protein
MAQIISCSNSSCLYYNESHSFFGLKINSKEQSLITIKEKNFYVYKFNTFYLSIYFNAMLCNQNKSLAMVLFDELRPKVWTVHENII